MKPSTFLALGLVVLALGSLAPQRVAGWADTCAGNLLESACYTNSSACHFNASVSACQNGTATTCLDIYRDTVTCAATSGCAVHALNKHCYKTLVGCAAIVSDPVLCALRSDCMVNSTAPTTGCITGTNTTRPSLYNADPQACADAGYFYDLFSPQAPGGHGACFYTAAAARAVYGLDCLAYSDFLAPYSAVGCSSHTGCSISAVTAQCIASPISVTPDVVPIAPVSRDYGDTSASFVAGYMFALICIAALLGSVVALFLWSICMGGRAAPLSVVPTPGTKGRSKRSAKKDPSQVALTMPRKQ